MSVSAPRPAILLALCAIGGFVAVAAVAQQYEVQFVAPPVAAVAPVPAPTTQPGDGEEGTPENNQQIGFSIRREDTKVMDKLGDFRRHSEKKSWELAFRAVGELSEMDLKGMLPVEGGLLLPSRQQIWLGLNGLPPEGREAYRLFYDAKAKQLFEHAKEPGCKDELKTLRKIFDQYFITSVGDVAADRLGDACFASGDFSQADAAWKAILDHRADTTISKTRLRAKRCAALARAGRWLEFDAVAADLSKAAPGETIVIGGKPAAIGEYLKSLRSSATRPSTTQPAAGPQPELAGPLTLPTNNTPLWQARFVDEGFAEQAAQMVTRFGWDGAAMPFSNYVPASATDGKRVYVNWFGVAFALDARTGKLLWRSRKLSDVVENTQQFVMGGVNLGRYHLTLAGDKLLITGVPFDQLNNGQGTVKIVCHNAETGSVIWSNKNGTAGEYSMVSQPLVVDQTIYVAAQKNGQQEMHLVALDLASGKLQWGVSLGTPQAGVDYRGFSQASAPALAERGGTVYVLTNNGALLAVDSVDRRIAWALTYDPPASTSGEVFYPGQGMRNPPPGAAIVRGSTLFVKETSGRTLLAIDLDHPSILWQRPVDGETTISGIDDRQIYLAGSELSAIDAKSRTMRWSTKLPAGSAASRVIRGGDSLYLFSSRGMFELETETGDPSPHIFRTADLDAVGGVIWRTPERLITVSNLTVTAYPAGGRAPSTAPTAGNTKDKADGDAAKNKAGGDAGVPKNQ